MYAPTLWKEPLEHGTIFTIIYEKVTPKMTKRTSIDSGNTNIFPLPCTCKVVSINQFVKVVVMTLYFIRQLLDLGLYDMTYDVSQ